MADSPATASGNFLTTASTIFTVPAGKKFILRSIHISNNNSGASSLSFYTRINGVATYWLYVFTLNPSQTYDWSGFVTLPPGATIEYPAGMLTGQAYHISYVEVDV